MKIRTKPVTKWAWKISELLSNAKNNWEEIPIDIRGAFARGEIIFLDGRIEVQSHSGWLGGDCDEYVIMDNNCRLSICRSHIFASTYEVVE